MNRLLKIASVVAAVCLGLGILLSSSAAVLGGTLDGVSFVRQETAEGTFYGGRSFAARLGNYVRGIFGGGAADPKAEDSGEIAADAYSIEEIRDLEIVGSPARIVIEEGGTDPVIRVERTSEKITMKEKRSEDGLRLVFGKSSDVVNLPEGAAARIILPENYRFRKVELKAEAASIEADCIDADKLEVSADASSVSLISVSVEKAELKAEGGSIDILEGNVEKLEINVDLGNVNYSGSVQESIEADCDLGSIWLCVDGSPEDFDYTADESMGEILVEDILETGAGEKDGKRTIRYDGAEKTAKLSCSMGSIEMEFQ